MQRFGAMQARNADFSHTADESIQLLAVSRPLSAATVDTKADFIKASKRTRTSAAYERV
jgi:hypothetical protein